MHHIGLRGIAIVHMGYIADVDHGPIHRLDRQVVQVFQIGGGVVQADGVFVAAHFLGAHRDDDVLRGQGIGHVLRGQASRLQGTRVQIQLHQTRFATIGKRHGRTRHGHQGAAHLCERQVGQVLLGQALARQGQLQDRDGGSVVVDDDGRLGARRHLAHHELRYRGDLRIGHRDVHAGLEKDFDDAHAVVRVGLDVFDVVHCGGEDALKRGGDATSHLIGRQAGVRPGHSNHRNANFRKDVGGGFESRQRPQDE